jgi:hypothetical protein
LLKTNELIGILDGSEPSPPPFVTDPTDVAKQIANLAHALWEKKDQFILSWITTTLAENVLATIYGLTTARQVWTHLANRFASKSQSRISHLKRQLHTLQQGSQTCTEYLCTAKSLANQLTTIGHQILDEDLISFILSGLNSSYNILSNFIPLLQGIIT